MATLTLGSTIGFSHSSSSSDISAYCIPSSTTRFCFSSIILSPLKLQKRTSRRRARALITVKMAAQAFQEVLPPALTSVSEPPPIFDGTTRLYISYTCPYAQRVWITRNCKGLQNKIQLVPINLQDRPSWYKEKVYPPNKVPALEHNNEVKGESLDLIKYIDSNFEGPSLFPDEPGKREFAEELINYVNSFTGSVVSSFKGDGNEADVAFDYIESALSKYGDGPFFLGQFSLKELQKKIIKVFFRLPTKQAAKRPNKRSLPPNKLVNSVNPTKQDLPDKEPDFLRNPSPLDLMKNRLPRREGIQQQNKEGFTHNTDLD
ncbi:protein IN2-1-like protein B [Cucumis melo var. makuwa]|uniref:Protein IN2-1-like protein B n=1 Tax=Cucumis melo var. makuwa TaxID=1194695 RepID=A0A5A7SXP4_CUCMM|nr:protein IN2-1-like protein B [Cucumis melo var. makuwa]